MKIKSLFAITLFCLSFAFAANGQVIVSQAYELKLSNFQAPATLNADVSFQECATCERKKVRATSDTRYAVNNKTVRLEDFKKAVAQVIDRDSKSVTVLHHLESDTVVSISVSL